MNRSNKSITFILSVLPAALLSLAISTPTIARETGTQGTVIEQPKSMSETIAELEDKFAVKKSANRSVLDRLDILEIEAFGTTKSGPLVDRIENLKKSLEKNSDTADTADEGEKKLLRKDDESIDQYIRRLNNSLPYPNIQPARFFRINPVGKASNASSSDYLRVILKATKNKVLRFNKMPIPVYITPQRNRAYTQACIKGFEAWETRTRGNIRFVQVSDKNEARIRVIWKQLGMSKDKDDCALGAHTVTKWKKKGKGKVAVMSVGAIPIPLYIPRFGPKYKVPPQVIEVNMDLIDSKRQDIKFLVLQNIVTHELGHALGILGHSDSKTDMMYPVTDEHSRISNRDLSTLSRLYKMKVDIPL